MFHKIAPTTFAQHARGSFRFTPRNVHQRQVSGVEPPQALGLILWIPAEEAAYQMRQNSLWRRVEEAF